MVVKTVTNHERISHPESVSCKGAHWEQGKEEKSLHGRDDVFIVAGCTTSLMLLTPSFIIAGKYPDDVKSRI
jgi:hypothetical protein